MNSLNDDELNVIVNTVFDRLRAVFVSRELCDERYKWLRNAILGLYAFIGIGFVSVIATLVIT